MNCPKCNAALAADDKFCQGCGAAVENAGTPTESAAPVASATPAETAAPAAQSTIAATPAPAPVATPIASAPVAAQNPNTKWIILGACVAVAMIATVIIAISMVNGNKGDSKKSGDDKGSSSEQTGSSDSSDGSDSDIEQASSNNGGSSSNSGNSGSGNSSNSGQTAKKPSSSYETSFGGFSMYVPDDIIAVPKEAWIQFADESSSWATAFAFHADSFALYQENRSQLATFLQQQGLTCNPATAKTLGGVEYIALECKSSGEGFLLAYAKADNTHTVAIEAHDLVNAEPDYALLEKMAPIIKSLKPKTSVNNLEIKSNALTINPKFNK